jgi:hypothetical protein
MDPAGADYAAFPNENWPKSHGMANVKYYGIY